MLNKQGVEMRGIILFVCVFSFLMGCSSDIVKEVKKSKFVSEEKMREKLIKKYEQQVKITPQTAMDYADVGFAFYNLGQNDAALEYFQQAKVLFEDEGEFDLAEEMDKYLNLVK